MSNEENKAYILGMMQAYNNIRLSKDYFMLNDSGTCSSFFYLETAIAMVGVSNGY